ncbi:uncharacterized protein N7473_007556 [Penicillium subrubescens]|uniref:uncharacterized protein n=1 Tax=Penicillium subrubescens TaxID=1316194 RepID=UPI002545991C|nr:uncharacterized protein N7473_007556 [Penicillium subrubescens]KAJ5891328.1 hypothetical protein N7473_007556 [Penicillium subrubescens]
MDHSFTYPYHHPLAQMPTDQREHEHQQPRVSVQTGLYQMVPSDNNPHPYHPGPSVENWSAFRSNLAPEALISLHQTGFSTPWGATPQQYDFGTSSLTGVTVSDTSYLASFYSSPHANMHPLNNSHAPRRSEHDNSTNWQTAPTTTSLLSQRHIDNSLSCPDTPEQSSRSMRATPASPPISISSSQSPSHSRDSGSMSPALTVPEVDTSSPRISLGDSSDQDQNGGPPYSRLIWEALMSTEEKMLPLQGIYQWFEKNTNKGGNEESKGWQNSIRHNLSMNAGFEAIKVETPGKKPANYWRLTKEAIQNGGVQSTTRYRKMSAKKALSSDPDPRRQRPGSRGGKKIPGVMRHAIEDQKESSYPYPRLMLHQRNVRQNRSPPLQARSQPQHLPQPQPPTDIQHFQNYNNPSMPTPSVGLPQYAELNMPNGLSNGASNDLPNGQVPNGLPNDLPEMTYHWRRFDLSSVIGTTTPPPNNMVFCDTAEGGPAVLHSSGPGLV